MVEPEQLIRLHTLEHRLWGKGQEAANYDKPLWTEFDNLIAVVCAEAGGSGWLAKAQEAVKEKERVVGTALYTVTAHYEHGFELSVGVWVKEEDHNEGFLEAKRLISEKFGKYTMLAATNWTIK